MTKPRRLCVTQNLDVFRIDPKKQEESHAVDNKNNTPTTSIIFDEAWSLLGTPKVKKEYKTGSTVQTKLISASLHGHTYEVEKFIKEGADPNRTESSFGATALTIASYFGYIEIVKVLLKNGAKPNITDGIGCTALMCASRNGYTEIVKLLLENNADPNIKDNIGLNALDRAMKEKHSECVRILNEYQKA